ncbi:Putative zinc-finger [Tenacibaculum sp. MAR_2009_124]|uniref:zf-HC2 domain-containing protein n=1 Tax=Tenacibaculum sp. MAR_2009_124 TaxID=1250059 RepID=UPI00089CB992|nr:zf-HC2 domain-containing protein [Tenacibaculum sp. MAR_2009_124]SEC16995.1 Putative zinc-finger [Tenacibaculum sp. MAR_2009_124]
MECKDIQQMFSDYLEGNTPSSESIQITSHIETCSDCSEELEKYKAIFSALSNIDMEKPSVNLKAKFDSLLNEEIERNNTKTISLKPSTDWKTYIRVAASILIVSIAFLTGRFQSKQTTEIANKTHKEERKQFFELLENQSVSKRILGVNNSQKFTEENTEIIEAIIRKLFYDKNTNVRLTAAEALSKFSSLEIVKSALIKALETEKEAIIQIELIQILASIQEKRALKPMKKLLENKETPNYVKQELQFNIPSLL